MTGSGVHRQSYVETRARACQLAHALRRRGIAIGDRVATFMWNGRRHLEAYQALPSMGAVLHTLNIRLSPRELEYIVTHAHDRVILVDADLLPLLGELRGKMPSVELIVVGGEVEAWSSPFENAIDWDELIASEPTHYDWPTLDENAPMGLCYTSGTTGNPKGVMYTHRSTYLHTMAQSLTDAMGLSATDAICGIVPMFHAMGWGLPFSATMLGAKQVMPHRFMETKGLLDLMAVEQALVPCGAFTNSVSTP